MIVNAIGLFLTVVLLVWAVGAIVEERKNSDAVERKIISVWHFAALALFSWTFYRQIVTWDELTKFPLPIWGPWRLVLTLLAVLIAADIRNWNLQRNQTNWKRFGLIAWTVNAVFMLFLIWNGVF